MPADPQFYMTLAPTLSTPGFERQDLGSGVSLYAQPGLNVSQLRDTTTIGIRLNDGGGRFVSVDGQTLTSDTCNLRGLYYFMTPAHGTVAVSCPSVAERLGDFDHEPRVLAPYSFNFHPTPGSPLKDLSTLLPFQQLSLADGATSTSASASPLGFDDSQRTEGLLEALSGTIAECAELGRLVLPLTAGLDSRTLLAASLHAGLKPHCMTIAFDEPSAAEARLAAELAGSVGLTHQTIIGSKPKAKPPESPPRTYWNNFDRRHVQAGSYAGFDHDDVLIRGGVFEIGSRYFSSTLGDLTWKDIQANSAPIATRSSLGPLATRTFARHVERWVRCRSEAPLPFHWMDLFYMDQRLAGWLAGVERTLEVVAATSIHPANQLRSIELLTDEGTTGDVIQRQLITQVAPRLNDYPHEVSAGRSWPWKNKLALALALVSSEAQTGIRLLRNGVSQRSSD